MKGGQAKHLGLIEIAGGELTMLLEGAWRVSSFSWLPDNRGLAISGTDNASVTLLTDRLLLVNRNNGEVTEVAQPDGPLEQLSVSADNRYLAYVGSTDAGPIPHSIYLQPVDGGKARPLTSPLLDRIIAAYVWTDDERVLALAAEGFGDQFVRLSQDGKTDILESFPDRTITSFDVFESNIAFVAETAATPQELWIRDESGERQISHLNRDFPLLVSPELIHYTGEGGVELEAALFTPAAKTQNKNGWPTVLLLHGGPAGRWSNRVNDWAQLLAGRGYAVLASNIRGSVGYGLAFMRLNRHDWGGADYRDAIAGIDSLVAQKYANPDQVAIAGWSYGGYLSAWAITQTNRFRAAIVGAPMTDLAVEYGTELAEISAYDTWYLGNPYENLSDFVRMSPMTYVKNARTPTLILVGAEDKIDPVGQSQQFYRGLKRYGVEAELIIYPREPHDIQEFDHRIDVLTRMPDWISTYTESVN